MKRIFLIVLAVLAVATVAHSETREERMAEFERVRQACAERTDRLLAGDTWSIRWLITSSCRRASSLRDDLIRCATERHHLRRAAACPHLWHGIGPKVKGCAKCESIAHFVNGEWLVVLADGIWVGPEPRDYPEDYGLK
jgi:hypothetical protein